ncbi:UNVERIFIED_CONTAM: hypothetical protein FKN15_038783 [Acipenser sinensis]
MYPSLALATNHGQSAYPHDSGNYLHSSASSPVYVPTTRVPSMLQTLPYLQSCDSAHQTHPLGSHHGWAQAGTDTAFNPGSPHAPSGFSYSHSTAVSSSTREGAYQNPLVISNSGRAEQYGNALVRSVNGSYSSPYPTYMSPEVASSWAPTHFETTMIQSLQNRRSSLGSSASSTNSPSSITTSESASTIKSEPNMSASPFAGQTVASVTQATAHTDHGHSELKYEDYHFTPSSIAQQTGLSVPVRQDSWCALSLA